MQAAMGYPQNKPENDLLRWAAVLRRDAAVDGAFVYAVHSTGIYCRPTCPSRRPRRGVVTFFPDARRAEQAGFRPCRRCRPAGLPAGSELLAKVRLASEILQANSEKRVTLKALGTRVGLSPFYLQRSFTKLVGISPRSYAKADRIGRLKAALKRGECVSSATYEAGFGSSSRVYERARAELGMTPATYRRGGRGVKITFTIASSPLGRLLVAATDVGVCRVMLGKHDDALERDLRLEYPEAVVCRDDRHVGRFVRAVLASLDGRRPTSSLPLDIQATAFQWRVWRQLLAIPYGETRSYGQVARAIGVPSAARAVARACATNPVGLVIPCHRVVRENGDIGGFSWGIERKRTLLKRERDAAGKTSSGHAR